MNQHGRPRIHLDCSGIDRWDEALLEAKRLGHILTPSFDAPLAEPPRQKPAIEQPRSKVITCEPYPNMRVQSRAVRRWQERMLDASHA